ncbi:MAG: Gfo/Idh/MocA family protein [Nitrospiraceae bacterium]
MTTSRKTIARRLTHIRYAVVGLGHIAQVAVLPAFAHAASNSRLTALVSGDSKKLKDLGRRYHVPYTYSYAQYDKCLREGHIDAVYIALPNNMHCDYATRAAKAGIHVLCEKPMAVNEQECRQMIRAADQTGTKLMIAYRLHLEATNVNAVEIARSGKLGKLRIFTSLFALQVREGDIRTRRKMGGGSLYDIGVYCINAARCLFQDNPIEVSAFSVKGTDRRFREVDEMSGALLRFPGERLASFICSFGAADRSTYELIGSKGRLQIDPAFDYVGPHTHHLTLDGKTRVRQFSPGDQFAAELLYFSDCILHNKNPESSGLEGLTDVEIVRALYRSAKLRRPVKLVPAAKVRWPRKEQVIRRPPVRKPMLVHTQSPSL